MGGFTKNCQEDKKVLLEVDPYSFINLVLYGLYAFSLYPTVSWFTVANFLNARTSRGNLVVVSVQGGGHWHYSKEKKNHFYGPIFKKIYLCSGSSKTVMSLTFFALVKLRSLTHNPVLISNWHCQSHCAQPRCCQGSEIPTHSSRHVGFAIPVNCSHSFGNSKTTFFTLFRSMCWRGASN